MSAQLWLTLAACQLEALDAGLKASSDGLRRESVSEGLGAAGSYNPRFGDSSRGSRGGKATWLADQSRVLQQQVSAVTGRLGKPLTCCRCIRCLCMFHSTA